VGALNAAHAGVSQRLILTNHPKRRAGDSARVDGLVELAFYVLLWPLQALWFVVFVGIPAFTEWLTPRSQESDHEQHRE
jgi:hypothetical protein